MYGWMEECIITMEIVFLQEVIDLLGNWTISSTMI